MASSSTSSVPKSFKYDVFLSFRGEDTRKNFIDHLYHALQEKNIHTYKDDERIIKGKRINDELIRSIEDSRYFIIVFSKNYASSSWCLNELLKIMECHKTPEHTVYPVFYDVKPSEVRNQIGVVGEVYARHEKAEAAGKWRKALTEAADIAGWELKKNADGAEAKFIRQIVEKLSLELRSINFYIDEKLVGMETRIKNIVPSAGTTSDDVHMIGIWGIGGGGKTTLAGAIFNHISFRFEGKSFIENVKEDAKTSGLKLLQKRVLSDVLNDQCINISSVTEGKNMMSWMMRGRKVLLVLDDVDHIDQLQALAGKTNWFMPGSVIIITTRDKQVLVAHGVKVHHVNLLTDKDAICLFTRYAFGREIPKGYEELSRQVVCYAAGLPLTIKVLGSSLCGKSKHEWVDALARLKTIPEEETQKKLELSYIGLDDEHKEMFLDVATILKGLPKHSAIKVLESCGFYAVIGLRDLEQKSLITIGHDNCVGMHDHLEDMGKNIVRRSHPNLPNKHSRLWDSKEIEDILAKDMGTEATRCIKFQYEGQNPEIIMQGLRKMKELRFLHVTMDLDYLNLETDKFIPDFLNALVVLCCNWKFNEVGPYFPDAIRYMCWKGYPFRFLPKGFQANNLVALEMHARDLVQLWEGGEKKVFKKLRFLYLSGSKLRFLDLELTPNLETLTLNVHGPYGDWVEVYMPVECPKLRFLRLNVKLRTFDIGLTPNLEELHVYHCDDLEELHMGAECVKLRILHLSGSKLRTLDLGPSPNLKKLDLYACNDLEEFHIAECPILTYIKIGPSKLRTLDLRQVPNLNYLSLSECKGLVELHMPGRCLNLSFLKITNSKLRTLVLRLTPILKYLKLVNSYDLEVLHLAEECQELETLIVIHSKFRALDLGLTPNLKRLDLENCCYLEELHMVNQCQKLISLKISNSKLRTLDLGLTPNLTTLDLKESYNLVELHAPIGCLNNIVSLNLSGCLVFTSFLFSMDNTSGIVNESLEDRPLAELYFTLESCPFHPDNHLLKFEFRCFHKEDLPSLRRSLEKLLSGGPCVCTKLERFSRSICRLQR